MIDHHLMRGEIPEVAALVNPNRPDCTSGQGHLAAAGVTFVLLAALNREARGAGCSSDAPSRTCANGSTSPPWARSAT